MISCRCFLYVNIYCPWKPFSPGGGPYAGLLSSRSKCVDQERRPGANRVPIARIAFRHVVEGEMELSRVDDPAKHLNGEWCQPVRRLERSIELRTRALPVLLGSAERPQCEDRHRQAQQSCVVSPEKGARVPVPSAHIQRRAKDDRAVVIEGLHLPRRPNLDLQAVLA